MELWEELTCSIMNDGKKDSHQLQRRLKLKSRLRIHLPLVVESGGELNEGQKSHARDHFHMTQRSGDNIPPAQQHYHTDLCFESSWMLGDPADLYPGSHWWSYEQDMRM
ncbi:hypothetical protein E2C01_010123 [Portunus trituberculatus]|uniref:Uncharacterized protein n=1 Tax=Portunus trituberculatus TaxID=210409 RepID=A0A5B7D7M8_PORTR|nr:hypothetical protein [Portunus trituberculatus]